MKALVVRFSAIGDCVMAVPVAAAIRTKYPEAEITWAVEPWCAPVIDTERLVNRVALFPRDEWEKHRWSPRTWRDQLRTYLSMRHRGFDIGIDLQGQAKTALCLRFAKPKKRIAAKSHDFVSEHLNPVLEISRGQMHTVEHSMLALSRLGDFGEEIRYIMPALKAEREKVRTLIPNGRLATLTVSAGKPKKSYALENWKAVGDALVRKGFVVACLGGPGDPPCPVDGAIDLVGKLKLSESMAAVAMSEIHIAADTGTGHMAAAYNVPVVSIFGATKPYLFRPYTQNGTVLDGKGSPNNISPEQVILAVEELLKRQGETVPH